MEALFLFALFLFLLSGLLWAGSGRSESRHSRLGSQATYLAGAALTALVLAGRAGEGASWDADGYLQGSLLAIVLIAVGFCAAKARGWAVQPGYPALLSLVIGGIGLIRARFGASNALPPGIGGHTLLMFIALSAFSASFLSSLLFLVQDRAIKSKRIDENFFSLPPLELLGRLNLLFLAVGTASMMTGVAAGALYLRKHGSAGVFVSPSTAVLSTAVLIVYSVIITLRVGPLERGRGTAVASIATYALLIVTFLAAHAFGRPLP